MSISGCGAVGGRVLCVCVLGVLLERGEATCPGLFQCESKIDSRGRGALGALPGSTHTETSTNTYTTHRLALRDLWQVLMCDRLLGKHFLC